MAGLDERVLRVDKLVMKHFRVPASNQEKILSAFQEDGWPIHIDDHTTCRGSAARRRKCVSDGEFRKLVNPTRTSVT